MSIQEQATAKRIRAGMRRPRRLAVPSERMMIALLILASSTSSVAFVPQQSPWKRSSLSRPALSPKGALSLQSSIRADMDNGDVNSSLLEFPPRWWPLPLRRKELKPSEPELELIQPALKISLPNRTKEEQARMNEMTLGAIVSVGVLYALAIEGDAPELRLMDTVSSAATNIFETAIPATTYDIVAVALGETLAGLTGAIASLSLNLLLVNTRKIISDNRLQLERAQTVINDAVAESDYFLARAAVLPILEGAGLPPGIATIASSLFATLPYELVKIGRQKRTARQQENDLLDELLISQQQALEKENLSNFEKARWNLQRMVKELRRTRADVVPEPLQSTRALQQQQVDPSALRPVQEGLIAIDGVELFADTCKWLSYAVLMKDFSGTMAWNGQALGPGIESGFYGLLATLTSQLYADFLYITAAAGPQNKRDQVRDRSVAEWIQLYLSKSLSAFTLFGVYASVQLPVRIAVNALLSGSIDSCIGSADTSLCIETYYTQNPPGADAGAQMRAVITTLYSFSQIPATYFLDQASLQGQLRAIITTLVSLMNRFSM